MRGFRYVWSSEDPYDFIPEIDIAGIALYSDYSARLIDYDAFSRQLMLVNARFVTGMTGGFVEN